MGLDIFFDKTKTVNLGQFRKVNFLISFFEKEYGEVRNVCPIQIHKGDIEKLLNYCNKVLDNHSLAPTLLPCTEGFFFGNTDYNEYYFEDVKDVRDFCEEKLLPEFEQLDENENIEFVIWY